MTDARADMAASYSFALAELRDSCQRECKTDKPISAFEALTWKKLFKAVSR